MTEYRFNIQGDVNISLMRELIDEFIDPENYEVTDSDDPDVILINKTYSADRDTVKRELYRKLCELTGKRQEWGALTGVRPVKLAGELIESIGYDAARERLSEFYYMSDEKINLISKAKNLKGKLQRITGYNDNTVVPQNCLSFLNACIEAGTQPDFFVYPGEEHNMRGHKSVHLHERITQYFEDYLK